MQGEKFFVLKKSRKDSSVLRNHSSPNICFDRPPVFRGALPEEMPASVASYSTAGAQSPDLCHDPQKGNRHRKRKKQGGEGRQLVSVGSAESSLDADVS